jgi:hypothetical protein
MAIVQRTGGPGSEVIVREDIDGVPTFSNLRTMPQAGDAATLQEQANRRVAEDIGIRQMQTAVVDQMRDAAPVYDQAGLDQRTAERIAQTEANNRGRSSAALKPLDLRKELEQQFARATYDKDGNITGAVADPAEIKQFEEIISQLNPALMADPRYGAPFHELPLEQRLDIYREYGPVLRDTLMANRAAAQQDLPTTTIPRTGDATLQVIPGSDISFWG